MGKSLGSAQNWSSSHGKMDGISHISLPSQFQRSWNFENLTSFNSLPYLHIGLRDLSFTPLYMWIPSNTTISIKIHWYLAGWEYQVHFLNFWKSIVVKSEKVLAKNVKIFILLMLSHMGDSRFQFSTKFRFTECYHLFGIAWYHSDFSYVKSTKLQSKSCQIENWDVG